MKKSLVRSVSAAMLALGFVAAMGTLSPSGAAESKPDITKMKTRPSITQPLTEAQKLMDSDPAAAMAKAKEADAVPNKNALEEYDTAAVMGNIAVKMQDWAIASDAFDRMLASGGVADAQMQSILSNAMLLDFQTNKYEKAAEHAKALDQMGALNDQGQTILAQSLFLTKDYAGAAQYAQKYVDALNTAGKPPNAQLLEILVNSKVNLGDQAGATAALDQLADVSNDPQVWRQITGQVLGGGHNLSDHQVINLLRLRMLTGSMEETDYTTLATLLLQVGLPGEAQSVLQSGISKGTISQTGNIATLLKRANTAVGPDQKALPSLAAAAKSAKTGDASVSYGESLYSYGRTDDAVAAIQTGIAKGKLKDPADAQVTLGIVLLAAGKKDDALAAFHTAEADEASAPVAHVWSKYAGRKSS